MIADWTWCSIELTEIWYHLSGVAIENETVRKGKKGKFSFITKCHEFLIRSI